MVESGVTARRTLSPRHTKPQKTPTLDVYTPKVVVFAMYGCPSGDPSTRVGGALYVLECVVCPCKGSTGPFASRASRHVEISLRIASHHCAARVAMRAREGDENVVDDDDDEEDPRDGALRRRDDALEDPRERTRRFRARVCMIDR